MNSAITMTVTAGPDKGKTFVVPGTYARLGRDVTCEMCLTDSIISRCHGTVERTIGLGVIVFSDHSRNGTYYVQRNSTQPTSTINQGAVVMLPGDSLMLGHSTLRLEDTFGETFTTPGAPLILPSRTPLLDALRTVGADLIKPDNENALVKVGSDHAQKIYLHPFTQLAIERGRQRRAALDAASGLESGSVTSDDGKDAFEAMAGIDTYRSLDGLVDATGIDSARSPAPAPAAPVTTARGVPAVSVGSSGMFPPLRPPHSTAGERKVDSEVWSPRVGDAGVETPALSSGHRGGAASGGAAVSARVGLSDTGKQLLHAALE